MNHHMNHYLDRRTVASMIAALTILPGIALFAAPA